jgi:hypothetical protein
MSMKLINILKEIKVYSPIPRFETNEQLVSYLRSNPKFREDLVDKMVEDSGISPENPDWVPIIQQWKKGLGDEDGINIGTVWNEGDELFLSSDFDDRLWISINDLVWPSPTIGKIPYGPNVFKYDTI